MGKEIAKQENNLLTQKLLTAGMDEGYVVERIKELFDWEEVKVDKNGNSYTTRDGNLHLKATELLIKLLQGKAPKNNNHLHVTEGTLARLLGADQGNKKKSGK